MRTFRKHRFAIILLGLIAASGAIAPLFLIAGCRTLQQTPQELQARETLRAMTRGGVLPAEDAVARIESDFPRTTAGALAKIVHARIKMNAKDFAGATSLLYSSAIRDYTVIPDYGLWMRASALEQANRRVEARATFEQLVRLDPGSLRARDAMLHDAQLFMQDGQAAGVPVALKQLAAKDDAAALLLSARAHEQAGNLASALAAYRRIYFFAPASAESGEAASAILRTNSAMDRASPDQAIARAEGALPVSRSNTIIAAASPDEAIARAEKLFAAKHFSEAFDAYTDAFTRFPSGATPELQARRSIAAANARRLPEATAALNATSGEARAEALFNLALAYGRAKQWAQARSTADDLRRASPGSAWTTRAFVQLGQHAEDAKDDTNASYFYRAAINFYPGNADVTPAQFYLAWQAHEAKNFAESSRMLTEHLANYADRNTDFRGKAAYWAARDGERSGKLAEARAIYQGLQARYDANWYGYLAKQRLDTMARNGNVPRKDFPADSPVGRAVANLQTVSVAEETAGPNEDASIAKADQLSIIGADDWALEELGVVSSVAPTSPRINLAIAKIYRARDDNVQALNMMKRSYPDYSQMKPEEMRRDEWDAFYPLAYWDIITQESRARSLDPYQVAGLIRQESVFNPRAVSSAKAYGLMQVVVPTGMTTAKKVGVERTITMESLFEPRLNIQLGTAYLRDQLDRYGHIEYVAAAYNAGPHRVEQWRATLPLELDEWAEAVPFRETRLYIQGVVRNTLQYRRLYDAQGQFRAEVGARAVYPAPNASPSAQPANSTIRVRRLTGEEEE
ncbi:MAG TPA: transglycosylase SLT domain-containing protein [Pyrinomonadaceae bacterium]|nr:transglycosylase SLT domain-containing protein [Pyrinomonadaceae bacterium]